MPDDAEDIVIVAEEVDEKVKVADSDKAPDCELLDVDVAKLDLVLLEDAELAADEVIIDDPDAAWLTESAAVSVDELLEVADVELVASAETVERLVMEAKLDKVDELVEVDELVVLVVDVADTVKRAD